MATSVLSNSHYNLRVTYNISGGQVVFTKIEGMSTDGYESHGYSSALYLNSSAIFSSGTVRFPGNSYYTIWEDAGGWGTSVFAGYFYVTNCGGASNLKFWYDFDVPSYTLTLKTSTGVDSFTGGGTYKSGTTATTKATASAGYTLSKYTGTNNSGTTETWTGCAGKTSHTDTWTIERNRTITAYATPNTYTVTYNKNNGTGTMSNSTATYDVGFTTRQNTFTRSGYTFNGWNEKADGSGQAWTLNSAGVYESGKGAWTWKYTKNITLYAQWKANNQYNVTYDANGGSTVDGISTWSNKATYGSTYTIEKNNYGASAGGGQWYVRDGYEFIGWSTSATATKGSSWASNVQTDVGNSYVTAKNDDGTTIYYWTGTWTGSWAQKDIVLYAVWKPKTYTLSFDANGGTNTLPSVSMSQTVTFDTVTSVWRNIRGAGQTDPDKEWITRTGYEFVGWGLDASSTSGTNWASLNLEDLETKDYIEHGDSYLTSTNKEERTVYYWRGLWRWARDYKLFALWRPYGTFTKTFDSGISSVSGGTQTNGYPYGTEVPFTVSKKSGYVLDYYTVDDGNPQELTSDTFTVTATDKPISIKVFSRKETYTISYDTDGGEPVPSSQQKEHNVSMTVTDVVPIKEDDYADGFVVNFNADGGSCDIETVTMKNTISYSFKTWLSLVMGRTFNSGSTYSYSYNKDDTLKATYTTSTTKGSIILPDATRDDVVAVRNVTLNLDGGICDYDNLESKSITSYELKAWYKGTTNCGLPGDTFTPSSNSDLTARWNSSTSPYSQVTVPFATKEGFVLSGWATSDGGSVVYKAGDTFVPSKDMSLYAVWKPEANTYIKINGEWKLGEIYVKDNGTWKKGQAYTKDTTWKH